MRPPALRIPQLRILAAFAVAAAPHAIAAQPEEQGDVVVEFGDHGAAFPKLKIPPKARFERDWEAEQRAWLERVVVDPFARTAQDKPWGADAVAFLHLSLRFWPHVAYSDTPPELIASGRRLLEAGCKEPLIRFFAGCWGYRGSRQCRDRLTGLSPMEGYGSLDGQPHIDAMQAAVNELDDSGYPRAPLRLFAWEISRDWLREYYPDRSAPWVASMAKWTALALTEGSYRPEEAGIFVGQTIRERMHPREHLGQLVNAVEASNLPQWARDAVLGCFEVEAGWVDRGMGYNVTAAGSAGFSAHLGKAEELFKKAWKAAPNHAEICARELEVILTGESHSEEDPSLWLQRSLAAEVDLSLTAEKWFFFRRPRWGGSVADMLAFGRACLEARRYDTHLPALFVRSVYAAVSEAGVWRQITRIPWVGDGLVEATRGELEAPGNAADREKWQSLLAVRAWIGGKFDVAQKEMKKVPGGRLHLAALEEIASLGTYVDWMATDLAIYGTPGWDDYRKGEAAVDLYATRDDAAALQHFERALKLSASDSKAARSLRALIALEKYEVQFATGEWTEIPLSLDTWRVRAGSFSNADDGSLVMHSDREARGFVCFQGVTGHRYDLRGHFTAEPGAGTPALFGVAVRAQRFASGAFLHFSSAPAENGTAFITNLRDHFRELEENGRKPATGKTAARDDNEFLVHVTPEAVSFELNGEKVVPEFETKRYARTFFDGRIGLIASHRDPPTFTRVTKLEIRKIGTGE